MPEAKNPIKDYRYNRACLLIRKLTITFKAEILRITCLICLAMVVREAHRPSNGGERSMEIPGGDPRGYKKGIRLPKRDSS